MVGFDKKAKTLVERLKAGMSELEIVSIIGMGDLGRKTPPNSFAALIIRRSFAPLQKIQSIKNMIDVLYRK
ncbi:hypothetical protein U1Q18_001975 [Sarracenia purpurea var. burkii]